MLSFQRITREPVIELLPRRFPVNEREIRSVVLQVAPHAIFSIRILHLEPRVVSPVLREQAGNFLVAVETLEGRRARPEQMATGTLRCSAERLVSLGKRPRRNLSARGRTAQKQTQQKDWRRKKSGDLKDAKPGKLSEQEHRSPRQ